MLAVRSGSVTCVTARVYSPSAGRVSVESKLLESASVACSTHQSVDRIEKHEGQSELPGDALDSQLDLSVTISFKSESEGLAPVRDLAIDEDIDLEPGKGDA